MASTLVSADEKYRELIQFLLGKTVVVDNIDHAIALARKFRQSLRIVTKDGELLNPGGSMSGGAFRNSSNLLGRRREIEELERQVAKRGSVLQELQRNIDEIRSRRNALRDELVQLKDKLQSEYLAQNTAKMRLNELGEKHGLTEQGYRKLKVETGELDSQLFEIKDSKKREQEELETSEKLQKETEQPILQLQEELTGRRDEERQEMAAAEQVRMQFSAIKQQEDFLKQNLSRIASEREEFIQEKRQYEINVEEAADSVAQKRSRSGRYGKAWKAPLLQKLLCRQRLRVLQKKKKRKICCTKSFLRRAKSFPDRWDFWTARISA